MALGLMSAACSEESSTAKTTAAPGASAAPSAATNAPAPTDSAATAPTTATEGTTAGTTATEGTTATDGTAAGNDAALNDWALAYSGGTAGAAAGDPIKIGYVNQEDFFPENTIGIDAGVAYINAELGGVSGRPIEIVKCVINTGDDGSKCGTEMANNSAINLVITGTMQDNHQPLYDALNGKKAVIIGNGITTEDFTTTAGQAFTAGSPGVIPGMGAMVTTLLNPKPKTAAIVYVDTGAGSAAFDLLLKPVLEKAGLTVSYVAVSATATAADVQSAMTAVGAETADVFMPIVTIQQCINVYDSIKALAIDPVVVTTGLCFGTPMTDHLKEVGETGVVPDGWYFGGYGYNYYEPDLESGMATYIAKVQKYGKPAPGATTLEYTGFAGPSFANIMTAAKFYNQIGADKADVASIDAKIRGFKGPMMIQVGPLDCGKQIIVGLPIFVSVCGSQMGIQQYKGGKWTSIADGLNGKPIDATKA